MAAQFRIFFGNTASDGSVTGALNVTEANDTLAATGTVVVGGTLTVTEANDTLAATGSVDGYPVISLRPDADTTLGGWTDQAGGTTNIYTTIDEATASDADYVQSPALAPPQIVIGTPSTSVRTFGYTGVQKVAQSFISIGVQITAIRIWLRYGATSTGTPSDGIVVKIYTVDGSHHPLTQVGVTSNTVSGGFSLFPLAPFDFTFSTPIAVTLGVEYAFVVERTGAIDTTGGSYYAINSDSADPYASGQYGFLDGSLVWTSAFVTAHDLIAIIDQPSGADLKVRLYESSTQIAEWTHTDIAATVTTATQTLTSPQLAAISNFSNLFVELDDNQGSVYRFALGDPPGPLTAPVTLRYRYEKI